MQGTPEMEEIMAKIEPYLKEGVDNYNRTWEAISNWKDGILGHEDNLTEFADIGIWPHSWEVDAKKNMDKSKDGK